MATEKSGACALLPPTMVQAGAVRVIGIGGAQGAKHGGLGASWP